MGLFTNKAEKFLEIAARKLCEKRGVDPEEVVCKPEYNTTRGWLAREEIEDFLKMVEAMDEAEEEIEDEARASTLEDE